MRILTTLVFLAIATAAFSQSNVGLLRLDPTFGLHGIWEDDFDFIGGQLNEIRAFNTFHYRTPDANTYASIIVAGKLGNSLSPEIYFGMCRITPNGNRDITFGKAGKVAYDWSYTISYPNSLLVPDSTSIIAAGACAMTTDSLIPAVYKFRANGDPDSTFGLNGIVALRYDDGSGGEFTEIDTMKNPDRYVASGYSYPGGIQLSTGFGAMKFTSDGFLDPSFGINGKAVFPVAIRKATGFLRRADHNIFFIGIDTAREPEIVLALMKQDGTPNPSFGPTGIKHTGIILTNDSMFYATIQPAQSATQPQFVLAIVKAKNISSSEAFMIAKFLPDGSLDPQYGTAGYSIAPDVLSKMTPRGISVSNDGSSIVSGSVDLSQTICAAAKFFPNGSIDPKFGSNGLVAIDAGGDTTNNSLIGFYTLGKDASDNGRRKYLGIGSRHPDPEFENAFSKFLVVRFDSVEKNSIPFSSKEPSCELYPVPANTQIHLSVSEPIISLSFTNAIGVSVLKKQSLSQMETIDVSSLPCGIYQVVMVVSGQIYRKSVVIAR